MRTAGCATSIVTRSAILRAMRVSLLIAPMLVLVASVHAAPAAAADNPWLAKRVLNIAHQGGEDEFPSNTLYAFKRSVKAGADMLELDVGVTRDGRIVVSHDTTLDRTTNGKGTIESHTLAQIRRLDGGLLVPQGRRRVPARPQTLRLQAARDRHGQAQAAGGLQALGLPRADARAGPPRRSRSTPINIEIKGRTKAEEDAEYVENAEVLAALLGKTARRDIIVVSFKQAAVDRFHQLAPAIATALGSTGRPRSCSAAARRATAWSRSSSRSHTSSATRR